MLLADNTLTMGTGSIQHHRHFSRRFGMFVFTHDTGEYWSAVEALLICFYVGRRAVLLCESRIGSS